MDGYEGEQQYTVRGNDPHGDFLVPGALDEEELSQVDAIMAATARLKRTEQRISTASERYMALGPTDMRAIHHLLVQENLGHEVSPSSLARQLGITTASTTKLLDRLERAGHIQRLPNPADRRSWRITVMPDTRLAAHRTIGRIQSARIAPVQQLTPAERETVLRYLSSTNDALERMLTEVLGPDA
ncbi:MAG: MarR family transcriptional regulator [Propionibacterium sp.]